MKKEKPKSKAKPKPRALAKVKAKAEENKNTKIDCNIAIFTQILRDIEYVGIDLIQYYSKNKTRWTQFTEAYEDQYAFVFGLVGVVKDIKTSRNSSEGNKSS
jgi:hypothetical protein